MGFLSFFNKRLSKAQPNVRGIERTPRRFSTSSNKPKNSKIQTEYSEPQDEQLVSEKKRARRRLIGAVVMVLIVVVGVPFLLDTEPKAINRNVLIQIPSKDQPTNPIVSQEDQQQSASSNSVNQTTPLSDETVAKSKTDAMAIPSSNKPPAADARSIRQNELTKAQSAKALAILNGTDVTKDPAVKASKPADKNAKGIVIQVAALATQEKVNELQRKLSSAGIKSFTQKVATASGDKIRVRVGPFSDKESADKVKMQLQQLGLNATLITP